MDEQSGDAVITLLYSTSILVQRRYMSILCLCARLTMHILANALLQVTVI